ncbi:immunoglobulin-like domain-containing protein [Schleiferilactobacillus harbinensis]|uniref:immunoglobulin-like domain-containing protein n=1 Tax=Schleiferilactobacillus harbinensis TaxID=304207 RepID=UPI00267331C5|nr:immunoglobulin-like domain-containing protein [Schleiferilactobacillus harbinensis]
MKKFSKVKYFGAVAAALLAVAPIAAPVVSQVASPSIVQADTTAQAQLNAALKDTANITAAVGSVSSSEVGNINQQNQKSDYASIFGNTFGKQLLSGNGNATDLAAYTYTAVIDGTSATGGTLANELYYNPKASYKITVTAYTSDGKVAATKVVNVNIANHWAAKVAPATAKVGTAASAFQGVGSIASALTVTDGDNKNVAVSSADFSQNTTVQQASYDVTTLSPTSTNDSAIVDASGNFTKAGQFYGVYKLTATASKDLQTALGHVAYKASKNASDIAANGGVYSDGTNYYVVRPILVTTGTNDQAYYPVIKYTTGTDSATSVATTTTYFNGDTIPTKYAYTAGTISDSTKFYTQVESDIYANVLDDGKDQSFYGFENSIKTAGLTTPLEGWTHYSIGGVQLTGKASADVQAQIAKAISNPFAAGTYKVPFTVTNSSNLSSTVYLTVTIGTNVGTPVATEFTGYTTITKGSTFDPYADVQFKNSSLDNGVIPKERIKVSSNVDTTTPGTYTVTYTVTNAAGNTATFTRTVVVTAGDLTESNADGVVYINKADGAKIYSDQATTSATDKTLDNTTAWKFHSVVKDSAGKIVAYNLGGKQYVKASEVSTSPVKAQAGVFTVNYPANSKWSIAVYNSDLKVQKLIPAKSTWATFGTKTLKDGKSYYNLGGNQWVRTDYGFWNAK